MRTRAMRQQAMPSCLPPQLIIAWLPTRDVAAGLGVSKDWCASPDPIFQAIAGRHGLQRVEPSWRATVRQYRSSLGQRLFGNLVAPGFIGAAQRDDVQTIQTLISGDFDINRGTSAGQTPLHIAAMWGNLNALNALIAAGADLNPQNWIVRTESDYFGGTPLHVAANSTKVPLTKRYRCAKRLIEAGANARLLNGEESAPYESEFPDNPTTLDSSRHRRRFRKLLKDAFHAQRSTTRIPRPKRSSEAPGGGLKALKAATDATAGALVQVKREKEV